VKHNIYILLHACSASTIARRGPEAGDSALAVSLPRRQTEHRPARRGGQGILKGILHGYARDPPARAGVRRRGQARATLLRHGAPLTERCGRQRTVHQKIFFCINWFYCIVMAFCCPHTTLFHPIPLFVSLVVVSPARPNCVFLWRTAIVIRIRGIFLRVVGSQCVCGVTFHVPHMLIC